MTQTHSSGEMMFSKIVGSLIFALGFFFGLDAFASASLDCRAYGYESFRLAATPLPLTLASSTQQVAAAKDRCAKAVEALHAGKTFEAQWLSLLSLHFYIRANAMEVLKSAMLSTAEKRDLIHRHLLQADEISRLMLEAADKVADPVERQDRLDLSGKAYLETKAKILEAGHRL